MSFTKINDSDFNGHGARSLDDVPQISALALKTEFDYPARNIVAPSVNRLINELEAENGAKSLGIAAPSGRTGTNVKDVVDKISEDLSVVEETLEGGGLHVHNNLSLLQTYTNTNADISSAIADKHTHSNKSTLDKYGENNNKPTFNGNPIGDVQVAYKTFRVGETDVVANSATDVIEFINGENIQITADADSKSITIKATGGGGGGGGTVTVIDNHTSTDTASALSANQGRVIWNAKADKDTTYTKTEVETIANSKVPATRTVNGKALESDITLSHSDVGALSSSTTHLSGDIANPGTKATNDFLTYNGSSWEASNPINDSSTSATGLWSSNKVNTELGTKANSSALDYWFSETKIVRTDATTVDFAITDWTKAYKLYAETEDNSPVFITNTTKLSSSGNLQFTFKAITSTQSGTNGVKMKLRVIV